jgi:hypothetical protein
MTNTTSFVVGTLAARDEKHAEGSAALEGSD